MKTFYRVAIREFFICQGVALTITLFLYIYAAIGYFWYTLAISLIYSNLSWLSINLVFYLIHLNWRDSRHWNIGFISKSAAAFYAGMAIATEIGTRIVSVWLRRDFIPFFSLWHLYLILLNLGASIAIVLLVAFYKNMKFRLEQRNREYMELENLQVRTRLAALQAKLNPHFLFNTLNVILDLAANAPKKIETVVLNLSDIYRKVLGQADNEWSTLGEEVELVRKYLEIEKIRLGKRLDFRIDWDENLAAIPLPPLLVEPLAENAVIHGISPKKEGGEIHLSLEAKADRLEIRIEDNGVGMTAARPEKGFGLHSVRERLQLIYGNAAFLSISPAPTGGTIVRLEVPLAP